MPRGRLIAISGGEGSGKTSVVAALKNYEPDFVYTREPGGTPVGVAIREILLNRTTLNPRPETELLLFSADRAEHVATVVRPALARDATVVTDRYWPDTFAYQWWASLQREDPRPFLDLMDRFEFPRPDLWIWLDVDPSVGLTRRRGAGDVNRIDAKALAFHARVREGFARLHRLQIFPAVRIDTSAMPLAAVAGQALAAMRKFREATVV